MAIISSKQQPSDSEPKPQRSRESNSDRKTKTKTPPSATRSELLQPTLVEDESDKLEEGLRPQRLADYIGQQELKTVLEIAIQAAKGRGETMDHLLLYGPPGLGKTTMALILATEMGTS